MPDPAAGPGSASASVVLPAGGTPPAGTPPAGAPPAGTPATFVIPEAFKDRPYLKGVDSMDKVYSMLDNSQKLIGERPSFIPKPDAPQADWDKFYEAAGRPKTAAEYQFELDPAVKMDEKVLGQVKEMMYKEGLTATQAKNLQKNFDAMTLAIAKERGLAMQKADTDFNKLAADTFGADRDKVLATAKSLLDTYAPAAFKAEIGKMSNENLILMAGVLKGISDKYIKADGAPSAGGPAGGSASTESLRNEARTIMASKEYTDPFHVNHARAEARVREIYATPGIGGQK